MTTINQAVKNAVGLQQKTVSSMILPLVDKSHSIPLLLMYSSEQCTLTALGQVFKYSRAYISLQVIHNPGIIPDTRLNDSTTDITVVFEGEYSSFQLQRATLAALPLDRSRYSYIVHSVPSTVSITDLSTVIAPASQHADFLYFTYVDQNPYESFGPH